MSDRARYDGWVRTIRGIFMENTHEHQPDSRFCIAKMPKAISSVIFLVRFGLIHRCINSSWMGIGLQFVIIAK